MTPLGPMGFQARELGIRTESLEMRRGVPDPRGLVRLARLARAWRPDVIHSHMVHANLMARALRLVAPVPALVSTIHNIYEGGPIRMAAYRYTNGLVDHLTIVSQAAADRFVGDRIVPRDLLTVIPNGVDTEQYRQRPAGHARVAAALAGARTGRSCGSRSDGSRSRKTIPTCSAPSRGCGRSSRRPCC